MLRGCPDDSGAAVTAILVVLAAVLIFVFVGQGPRRAARGPCRGARDPCRAARDPRAAARDQAHSTADVDPLVTGRLYNHAGDERRVYAGSGWGLTEYGSSGGPGDVGVDAGPNGLAEDQPDIGGVVSEAWASIAPPGAARHDHYGADGPTVYAEGLYSLTEPDHDPLVN